MILIQIHTAQFLWNREPRKIASFLLKLAKMLLLFYYAQITFHLLMRIIVDLTDIEKIRSEINAMLFT
jgi:hypothetical protein